MAITSTKLFKIGSRDYTSFIKVPTYKVNEIDTEDTWEDANGVKHTVFIHKHLSGSFTLLFDTHDQYKQFLDDLYNNKFMPTSAAYAENTTNTYQNMSFFVNNQNHIGEQALVENWTVIPDRVILKFEPINELPYYGTWKERQGIDVTVEADFT